MNSDTDQYLCTRGAITLYLFIFFLEIKFTALISHVYRSDIVIVTSKFLLKWTTKICGPLKWATARKKLRTSGLERVITFILRCVQIKHACDEDYHFFIIEELEIFFRLHALFVCFSCKCEGWKAWPYILFSHPSSLSFCLKPASEVEELSVSKES